MSEFVQLANAPIVEAIIDFTFARDPAITMDELQQVASRLADMGYVEQLRRHRLELAAEFTVDGITETRGSMDTNALLCKSANGLEAAQLRRDGYSYHRLNPYENWNLFQEATLQVWEEVRSGLQDPPIQRIQVAYLNRIATPTADRATWFTLQPSVPEALEASLSEFILSANFQTPEGRGMISLWCDSTTAPGLVCTLEVKAEISFTDAAPSLPEIRTSLSSLRDLKNRLFFLSLTPALKETMQ